MKTYNKLFRILRPAAFALLAAGLASCEADPVELEGGRLPSDRPGTPVGALYSTRSSALETEINIFAEGDVTEKLVYRLTAPVDHDVTVTLEALDWDLETCEQWNLANGYEKYDSRTAEGEIDIRKDDRYPQNPENYLVPFPVSKLQMPDGEITIPAGKTCSAEIPLSFKTEGVVKYFNYLLPLRVKTVTGVDPVVEEQMILVKIKYFPRPPHEICDQSDPKLTYFADLDVSKFKPELVCSFTRSVMDGMTGEEFGPYRGFDAVNLWQAEVKYDKSTQRALLIPSNDLRYVLAHGSELLDPVRKNGTKICITIQGGKTGLGFCNLSDGQINDFAMQVKSLLSQYDLDGINLWDRNSGYGREGMPEVNPTSYPKLIKALREALGDDKWITVADDGTSTTNFHDAALCDGIEVGKFIDFAWEARPYNFTNPWDPESDRKPFAGITKERYSGLYWGYYRTHDRYPENPTAAPDFWTKIEAYYVPRREMQKFVEIFYLEGFLHGNEEYYQSLDFPIGYGYGMNMETGEGLMGYSNKDFSYNWGDYSNNYFYKDWD